MLSYLWIAIGSALGGMSRYWISGLVGQRFGETFPWGTVVVNVTGSFVIGFYAAWTGPDGRIIVGPRQRHFVMTGICGGYTTFSAFSLQTLDLLRSGAGGRAALNVALSVVLCVGAVAAGHLAAAALNADKRIAQIEIEEEA